MSQELEAPARPVGSLDEKKNYAVALAQSGLLPDAYKRQPANVLLAMELGEALRIPPIQAINGVNVIKGKPSMSADLMAAVVRRAGHALRITETWDPLTVTAEVIRADDPEFTFRAVWDEKKARTAGLWGKGNWSTYASQMLRARAISEVCRQAASDALMGVIYTPEELGATSHGAGDSGGEWPAADPTPETPHLTGGEEIADAEMVEDPEPAAEREPAVPAATKAQLTALHTLLTKLDITDRDAGLEVISNLAGRAVESSKDLTKTEATMLIDALKHDVDDRGES